MRENEVFMGVFISNAEKRMCLLMGDWPLRKSCILITFHGPSEQQHWSTGPGLRISVRMWGQSPLKPVVLRLHENHLEGQLKQDCRVHFQSFWISGIGLGDLRADLSNKFPSITCAGVDQRCFEDPWFRACTELSQRL